jgi:hypothetical protein
MARRCLASLAVSLAPPSTVAADVDGALYLTGGGYVSIPSFNEDFSGGITVEAWVRFDSFPNWSRILDFGNGAPSDSLVFANDGTTGSLKFNVHNGTSTVRL